MPYPYDARKFESGEYNGWISEGTLRKEISTKRGTRDVLDIKIKVHEPDKFKGMVVNTSIWLEKEISGPYSNFKLTF